MIRTLLENRKATVGLTILAFIAVLALVGPWMVADPTAYVAVPLEPPSWDHWLGTTGQGQDVFAQTVVGTRSSLFVGFSVGIAVIGIGALIGTTAGYFGGWIDDLLSLTINVFLIMPGLPLMVVLAAYLPPGPVTIAVVLILTSWAWSARVIRSRALALRDKDFILAARVCGESSFRVIATELIPNMSSLLVSSFIGATIYAIGAQVALEFLGLGDISQVTWGTNLYWATNDLALLTGSWWLFVPSGLGIALVGFGLAMINNAIDELGNPRLAAQPNFARALADAGIEASAATPVLRPPASAPNPTPSESATYRS